MYKLCVSDIMLFLVHQIFFLKYKTRELGGSNKGDFDTLLDPKELTISYES